MDVDIERINLLLHELKKSVDFTNKAILKLHFIKKESIELQDRINEILDND